MPNICPEMDLAGGEDIVIRPDAYLPSELVNLLGSIMWKEPPARIARRCELIALAYQHRTAPNDLWDADRREIVRLLTHEADRFRRRANGDARLAVTGGGGRQRSA